MADKNISIRIDAAIENASAAKTLGDLKKSMKELKDLAVETGGSNEEAFNKVAASLGSVKDRLEDINEASNSLKGSELEKFNSSLSLLGDGLVNLDFEKVTKSIELMREGFKNTSLSEIATQAKAAAAQFVQLGKDIASSITDKVKAGFTSLKNDLSGFSTGIKEAFGGNMKGALEGVKQGFNGIGTAIKATGIGALVLIVTTLIANFDKLKSAGGAIGTIFTALGDVIEVITDGFNKLTDAIGLTNHAVEEAAKKQSEAAKKLYESNTKFLNNYKEYLELLGKDTYSTQVALYNQTVNYAKTRQAELQKIGKALTDEQKKELEEVTETIKNEFTGRKALTDKLNKAQMDDNENRRRANANLIQDERLKAKTLFEIDKEDRENRIKTAEDDLKSLDVNFKEGLSRYILLNEELKQEQEGLALAQKQYNKQISDLNKKESEDRKKIADDRKKDNEQAKKNLEDFSKKMAEEFEKQKELFYNYQLATAEMQKMNARNGEENFNAEVNIMQVKTDRELEILTDKYNKDLSLYKNNEEAKSQLTVVYENEKKKIILKSEEDIINLQLSNEQRYSNSKLASIEQMAAIELLMADNNLQNQFDIKEKYAQQYDDIYLTSLDTQMAIELSKTELTEEQKMAIYAKYDALRGELRKKQLQDTLDKERAAQAGISASAQASFGALNNLSQLLYTMDKNRAGTNEKMQKEAKKREFGRSKALGIAQGTIDTTLGIIRAFKDYIAPYSYIVAAATGVAGAANIATIASTRYEDESSSTTANTAASTPSLSTSDDNTRISVPTVFNLGNVATGNAQNSGGQRVYVLESDITGTQNRVRVIENAAGLR